MHLSLWAPTAHSVDVLVVEQPGEAPHCKAAFSGRASAHDGVWRCQGPPEWWGQRLGLGQRHGAWRREVLPLPHHGLAWLGTGDLHGAGPLLDRLCFRCLLVAHVPFTHLEGANFSFIFQVLRWS